MKARLAPHRVTPAHLELTPGGSADAEPLATTEDLGSSPPSSYNSQRPVSISSSEYFDLVVIGAGPAALALVARILESRPAALYTDQEHLYLHWLRKKQNATLIKTRRTNHGNDRVISGSKPCPTLPEECCCGGRMRILVIDKVGEGWLGLWDRQFRAFGIKRKLSIMTSTIRRADRQERSSFSALFPSSSSRPGRVGRVCRSRRAEYHWIAVTPLSNLFLR